MVDKKSNPVKEFFGPYVKDIGIVMDKPASSLVQMFLKPYEPSNQLLNNVAEKLGNAPHAKTKDASAPPIRFGRLANPLNIVDGVLSSMMGGVAGLIDKATDRIKSDTGKAITRGIFKAIFVTPFFIPQKLVHLAAFPLNKILDGIETGVRKIASLGSSSNTNKKDATAPTQGGDESKDDQKEKTFLKIKKTNDVNVEKSKVQEVSHGATDRAQQTWGMVTQNTNEGTPNGSLRQPDLSNQIGTQFDQKSTPPLQDQSDDLKESNESSEEQTEAQGEEQKVTPGNGG
jgi:hypothetical protein